MSERHQVTPAVFVAVINPFNEVLLLRRHNTGYMDDHYDLPSGHLEYGETLREGAARELREETSLEVKPARLDLFNVYQNNSDPAHPYIGFMFKTWDWEGNPVIMEPGKCDDMNFFGLNELPKTTPQVGRALGHLAFSRSNVSISFFNGDHQPEDRF